MNDDLRQALRGCVGADGWLDAEAVAQRGAGVFRADRLQACALVRPRCTQELSAVMALCHAHRQPVVPQGGLSGLVRGADAAPHELIVSTERMCTIEAIDPVGRTATVQAGVVLGSLRDAVQAQGLHYGVDFGARDSATIGGSIATNAGGNSVIRYGMTRESVLGLEVVLADGTVLSSMNRVLKNNSGFDLKHLFIGSEGLLGLVSRAVLRLHEAAGPPRTVLLACDSFEQVLALLRHLDRAFSGRLGAFEVMWRDYFELAVNGSPSGRPPLGSIAAYQVLAEVVGTDDDALEAALADAQALGHFADAVLAASLEQRRALWALRESVMLTFRHGPDFAFDVSMPLADMSAYAERVRAAVKARWPAGHCWIFGHLGDGNLHISIAVGSGDMQTQQLIEALVYEPLRELGGAISAEHGVGLSKKAWLPVSRTQEELALMRQLKRSLDPLGLLNPGKMFEAVA